MLNRLLPLALLALLVSQGSCEIISYLLVQRSPSSGIDALRYLENNLIPRVQSGDVHLDRLVFSFIDPSMKPDEVTNAKNLTELMAVSGLLPNAEGSDGETLKRCITSLKALNVTSYFAVGGWAYSCFDPARVGDQPSCSSNFPLTPDATAEFRRSGLTDDVSRVQPIANSSLSAYAAAWTHVTSSFGAEGVDLDYEENWFASQCSFHFPVLTVVPTWSRIPDGPFAIPYSVIKFTQILQFLKTAAAAANLKVSIAAASVGAFDIHDNIGGSNYWCPVTLKSSPSTHVCGQSAQYTMRDVDIGGNLKGIFYDMTHYTELNAKYKFKYNATLMEGALSNLDALSLMTYDLDDGYDGIGASWCIGELSGNHYTSRDPSLPEYSGIDCSMISQNAVLVKMFNENVVARIPAGARPHLAFGLEAGFPNYPINIDPVLPGGGTDSANPRYRWNDPFIMFSLPLLETISQSDMAVLTALQPRLQSSDVNSAVPDIHAQFLVINKAMFDSMKSAGADSLIVWSLYNADFNDHLGPDSWDFEQFQAGNHSAFGTCASQWGYTDAVLRVLFANAVTPENMLNAAYKYLPLKSC
jgi:hypothetical protein